jgi:hypothetical protein
MRSSLDRNAANDANAEPQHLIAAGSKQSFEDDDLNATS